MENPSQGSKIPDPLGGPLALARTQRQGCPSPLAPGEGATLEEQVPTLFRKKVSRTMSHKSYISCGEARTSLRSCTSFKRTLHDTQTHCARVFTTLAS
uniref:Uncharacterized protein n=1 Tax=Sphaerodactylus townsendi TaxID=933632 RepID=A0ACB8FCK0_9SAUR